jgi:hypothetical protein
MELNTVEDVRKLVTIVRGTPNGRTAIRNHLMSTAHRALSMKKAGDVEGARKLDAVIGALQVHA